MGSRIGHLHILLQFRQWMKACFPLTRLKPMKQNIIYTVVIFSTAMVEDTLTDMRETPPTIHKNSHQKRSVAAATDLFLLKLQQFFQQRLEIHAVETG